MPIYFLLIVSLADHIFCFRYIWFIRRQECLIWRLCFCKQNWSDQCFMLYTDLLTKDYNYDYKFVLSVPGSTPMARFFLEISAQYKSGRTVVDVKVDTYCNVSTKVTVNEVMSSTKSSFELRCS
ncbi:putative porin, eukaryotic type, Porin domain superfamily [Helianthus annuus]|nr:putative porin, eukaryotic type, Porin domain superfamily [Helianthus annuus]